MILAKLAKKGHYQGALQRYRLEDLGDTRLLLMSPFLIDCLFPGVLYRGVLDAIRHLWCQRLTVTLSDGDVVFPPRKIDPSGLWDAVDSRVVIYIDQEEPQHAVAKRGPARRYVMIDDKLRILAAMKKTWEDRLTTIFPC